MMIRFSVVLIASLALCVVYNPYCVMADETLSDSGISYKEIVETIGNPGAGYTSTRWCYPSPGRSGVYYQSGNLVLFFIDIGAFSSGMNGVSFENGTRLPGQDISFDEFFIDNWRKSLDYCRKTGSMVGMRFRYDSLGKSNPEPGSFDFVLHHIQQLVDGGIFEDYKDIIALIESGFVGAWGEQHSGKYTSVQYKARLLDFMLKKIPENIAITVRTPDIFACWAGTSWANLNNSDFFEKARSSTKEEERRILTRRVGVFNDGYMGTNADYGTFHNREIETNWIGQVTPETYYGGEFSGDMNYAMQFDTYKPINAIPEMYKTHLSYINGNIFSCYRDFTFDQTIASLIHADNSAYLGQNTWTFIRDHLGYRFVLRKCELTKQIKQGETLKLRFRVENTGFSAPVPHTHAYVLLENDDVYIKTPVDIDTHYWNSCTINETELNIKIPDHMKLGQWGVYLKLVMGGYSNEIEELSLRSIRFANKDVWKAVIGANYMGTVEISEAEEKGGYDNLFYELKTNLTEVGPATEEFLRSEVKPVVDGKITYNNEWTENYLFAQDGDKKLYLRADEKYLYLMARVSTEPVAPVFNAHITSSKFPKTHYWTYAGQGTAAYYNHPNYAGCECKWTSGLVEFRLPFTWLNLTSAELEFVGISVSLQDSSVPGWGNFGSIGASNVTVPVIVSCYTVERDMVLKGGSDYSLRVISPVEGLSYQWLKDGTPLDAGSFDTYNIIEASNLDKGSYSVILKTVEGGTTEVKVANVLDVIGGEVGSATVVVISKWLLMGLLALMMFA